MNRVSFLALLSTLSAVGAQAATFDIPLMEKIGGMTSFARCSDDQIGDSSTARRRIDWAYRCGHLDSNIWEFSFTHVYDRASRGMVEVPAGHLQYPIFTTEAAPYTVWNVEANTNNLESCAIPAGITFYSVCMSGCFEPSQEVLMAEGYRAIGEVAAQKDSAGIYTMKPGSTFDSLNFVLSPIGYFVSSDKEGPETLVRLRTQDGSLTVTKNHPLVNSSGFVSMADQFSQGDSLVRDDGTLSPIVSKEYVPFFGRVHNVAPQSTNAEENVIVAQGFLNGSHRFQEGALKDFFEIVVRRNLPATLY